MLVGPETRLLRSLFQAAMNCAQTCPKGLNPTRAIGKIKDLMVKRAV